MAGTPLIFNAPPLTRGHLVFGDDGSPQGPGPDAHLAGAVILRKPALAGTARLGIVLAGACTIRKPSLAGGLRYFTDTERPLVGQFGVRYQQASALESGVQQVYGEAADLLRTVAARYQQADRLIRGLVDGWQDAPLARRGADARYQDALRLGGGFEGRYQESLLARRGADLRYQDALRRGAGLEGRYQESLLQRRGADTRYQDALRLLLGHSSVEGRGAFIEVGRSSRYQDALRPPPGRRVRPGPPQPEPCYTPSTALLFSAPGVASGALLFVCENHGTTPTEPGATVVVPVRRAYIVLNDISLIRADDGAPIPASAFAMSVDADSWTWQWQATLPAAALPLIEPVDGEPVQVLAQVNGVPYRLCVERYSRERRFAASALSVAGRGRAAILDAPYAPVLNHAGAADATVQQLLAQVLSINGVGIGWNVEFAATDWLVPGGSWTLQGTYIAGVLDIAEAAGAIVQPHDTAATLRLLPRYPAAPWAWGDVAPDFELPAAVVAVEGIEWVTRPDYNRIFVAGSGAGGVRGQVTRAGTAGDLVAPMVTHPLITHADAARQRGLAELANTGRQALVRLRLPVLEETGLIKPGQFVRYLDGSEPRVGLVRGTALEWQRPTLRQSITLETHLAEV